MVNSSDKSEAPDNLSEEDVELIYVDPSHPERGLRIETNLPADEKVQFKDCLLYTSPSPRDS